MAKALYIPCRNCSIAALSDELFVIDAGRNSGIKSTVAAAERYGKEVGRLVPKEATISYLTDSLTGILKGNHDLKSAKEEMLREKYATTD